MGLLTATTLRWSAYCQHGHSSVSCSIVTDVAQRKHILKKAGRCFVYPERDHLSPNCHSPINCAHCNGCHHTSICRQGQVNTPSPGSSSPRNQGLLHPQNQEVSHPLNHDPLSSLKPPTNNHSIVLCKHISSCIPPDSQGLRMYTSQISQVMG